MPVIEFAMLLQFFVYRQPDDKDESPGGQSLRRNRILFIGGLFGLWITILLLELVSNIEGIASHLLWIPLVLWSTQALPQIALNFKLTSTEGQSSLSLLLTFFGKTSDFTSQFALDIESKYRYMHYFSASLALINV